MEIEKIPEILQALDSRTVVYVDPNDGWKIILKVTGLHDLDFYDCICESYGVEYRLNLTGKDSAIMTLFLEENADRKSRKCVLVVS